MAPFAPLVDILRPLRDENLTTRIAIDMVIQVTPSNVEKITVLADRMGQRLEKAAHLIAQLAPVSVRQIDDSSYASLFQLLNEATGFVFSPQVPDKVAQRIEQHSNGVIQNFLTFFQVYPDPVKPLPDIRRLQGAVKWAAARPDSIWLNHLLPTSKHAHHFLMHQTLWQHENPQAKWAGLIAKAPPAVWGHMASLLKLPEEDAGLCLSAVPTDAKGFSRLLRAGLDPLSPKRPFKERMRALEQLWHARASLLVSDTVQREYVASRVQQWNPREQRALMCRVQAMVPQIPPVHRLNIEGDRDIDDPTGSSPHGVSSCQVFHRCAITR